MHLSSVSARYADAKGQPSARSAAGPHKSLGIWLTSALALGELGRAAAECGGFSPYRDAWRAPPDAWPNPTNRTSVDRLAHQIEQGPACGPAWSYRTQVFACNDTPGMLIGALDTLQPEAAVDFTKARHFVTHYCKPYSTVVGLTSEQSLFPCASPSLLGSLNVGLFFATQGEAQARCQILETEHLTDRQQLRNNLRRKMGWAFWSYGLVATLVGLGVYVRIHRDNGPAAQGRHDLEIHGVTGGITALVMVSLAMVPVTSFLIFRDQEPATYSA